VEAHPRIARGLTPSLGTSSLGASLAATIVEVAVPVLAVAVEVAIPIAVTIVSVAICIAIPIAVAVPITILVSLAAINLGATFRPHIGFDSAGIGAGPAGGTGTPLFLRDAEGSQRQSNR
jgi:hypothetical protein